MNRRRCLLPLLLGLCGLVGGGASLEAAADELAEAGTTLPTLTPSARSRVVDEAIDILGGFTNVVSRWNAPIRFAVIGGTAGGGAETARTTIADVTAQSALPLVSIEAEEEVEAYLAARRRASADALSACDRRGRCANFIVLIAELAAMRELAEVIPLREVYRRSLEVDGEVHCFFAPFLNRRREIVRAFVFVQADLPPALRNTCLVEEIYQSFGLFGDVTGSRHFSFDNRVKPKRVTAFDRALLASLYAPGIGPGSPVFAVLDRFVRRLGPATAR